jgi:hypothetical protein
LVLDFFLRTSFKPSAHSLHTFCTLLSHLLHTPFTPTAHSFHTYCTLLSHLLQTPFTPTARSKASPPSLRDKKLASTRAGPDATSSSLLQCMQQRLYSRKWKYLRSYRMLSATSLLAQPVVRGLCRPRALQIARIALLSSISWLAERRQLLARILWLAE